MAMANRPSQNNNIDAVGIGIDNVGEGQNPTPSVSGPID